MILQTGAGGRRVLVGVSVLAVVVAVALGALELAARVVFDSNGMHYGIEMWKYAKQLKRRSANYDMGHEHVPGRSAHLMGVDVEINSLGLREREFDPEKQAGVYRILVLGDSMTFGWGARFEDTFPKVLERKLNAARDATAPRFEVIDSGVGNYNTAQELAYFESRGIELDPDMVILGFYLNDAEPTPRAKSGFLTRHSYLYVLVSSFWDALARQWEEDKGYEEYYLDLYREDAEGWRVARRSLRELMELCEKRGIALRILMIPELHSPAEGYLFERVHDLVREIAETHDVPVIEVRQAMSGIDPAELWVSPGDTHPSELAHRIMGEELFADLSPELLSRTAGAAGDGAPRSARGPDDATTQAANRPQE